MGRPPLPPEQRKPRLSGMQRRKLERERHEAALAAEEAARPTPEAESWAAEFNEAGDPDLENPGTDLSWVRKLQLITLRQMSRTARPTTRQSDAWRRIREMSAVVGMTSNRAALEAELKRLRAVVKKYEQAATTAVTEVAASQVQKPPTARGGARPALRTVVDDPPEAEPT